MRKFYNLQNTISLTGTLLVLLFTWWSRTGLMPLLTFYNYMSIFSLAAIIFILPDFIAYYSPGKNRWFETEEFYTMVLLLVLGMLGLIAGQYAEWFNYLLLPVGIGLAFGELISFLKLNKALKLLAGTAFMGFIILLFYSRGFHSPVFPEIIILGQGGDQLFHSSISNMFLTTGWPTTGLDGSPFFQYHWGSHILFAGLKNLIGINTILFYNVVYPAIFIPLFFKSFFSFLHRLFIFKHEESVPVLFVTALLAIIYSFGFGNMTGIQAMPLVTESLAVSIVFTFLYGSVLLAYVSEKSKNQLISNQFILFSTAIILIIASTKISTGFVLAAGLLYLALRTTLKTSVLIKIFISGLIIAILTYLVVFPEARAARNVPFMGKVANFWASSNSFITYFLGVLLLILVVMKHQQLKSWNDYKKIFDSKKYLDLEVLFIFNLVGAVGALYVSANMQDVYVFFAVQLYISLVFITYYLQNKYYNFKATNKVKTLFLLIVLTMSIISRLDILKSAVQVIHTKRELTSLTKQQEVLKEYINELFKLDAEGNKKGKCIYIPHSEKWYYKSQYWDLGSAMITPAVSGIALIGGISDSLLSLEYNYYSLVSYQKNVHPPIEDITVAKKTALRRGFKELIQYKAVNGKLEKEIYFLDN
jgi:hypothetical protein